MGSLRNPVGSLAPAVYWRRRVLVLLAVLAALALLLYACSGSGSGKKQPAAHSTDNTPAASQSSVPNSGGTSSSAASSGGLSGGTAASSSAGAPSGGTSATAGTTGGTSSGGGSTGGTATGGTSAGTTPTTGATGAPGCRLSLSLSTQAPAYANGDDPRFTVAVVNNGTTDCDVDVSPKSLVLNVYSGPDHIWSSADCATGGKDLRGIAPHAVETITYTWNRTRSTPSCPANPAAAKLGMYYGVVSLGQGTGPNAPAAQSQPRSFELKTGS